MPRLLTILLLGSLLLQMLLPAAIVAVHRLSKEGMGTWAQWRVFPPTPAVTMLMLPLVKHLYDKSTFFFLPH